MLILLCRAHFPLEAERVGEVPNRALRRTHPQSMESCRAPFFLPVISIAIWKCPGKMRVRRIRAKFSLYFSRSSGCCCVSTESNIVCARVMFKFARPCAVVRDAQEPDGLKTWKSFFGTKVAAHVKSGYQHPRTLVPANCLLNTDVAAIRLPKATLKSENLGRMGCVGVIRR